jgi:hypothetical protein
MSWAQLHRLRHFDKGQLVFNLGMHQLSNGSQAGRTKSASQRPHGAALACKGIDQCGSNRLLDGIQKQLSTRKPRDSFSIHRLDERSQSHINHFAPVTGFSRAADSLAGGSQGSIGDAEEQTLLVAGPNPSFHATWKKSHFACLEPYSSHCGTLQAHLNEAGPQHHTENMLILHLHARLSGRRMHIYSHSHSLGYPLLDDWML